MKLSKIDNYFLKPSFATYRLKHTAITDVVCIFAIALSGAFCFFAGVMFVGCFIDFELVWLSVTTPLLILAIFSYQLVWHLIHVLEKERGFTL